MKENTSVYKGQTKGAVSCADKSFFLQVHVQINHIFIHMETIILVKMMKI